MEKNKVFFQKPNLELFDSMGLSSVDMHFHSRFSDSYTRIRTIIKKAKKKKIGIAVTDHNAIEGSIKAAANAQDVMVVPGIEVSCMEGPHLCLYFYSTSELEEFHEKHILTYKQKNPFMAINRCVADVIEDSKDFNCLRVAPHPYGYSIINSGLSKCVGKNYVDKYVLDSIDAMEAINGSMGRRLNKKAYQKITELGVGFTGGTDGHTIFEMGKVVTCAYADDVDSFLTSVLKKKNYVIGKEIKFLPKLHHGTNVVTKHIKYAGPSIRLQYQINKGRMKNMPKRILSKGVEIKNKIKNIGNGKH